MNHPATRGLRGRRTATAATAALLALAAAGQAGATPPPPTGAPSACSAQRSAVDAINGEIDAHNARPHTFELPREQAGFDAYNAEAAEIRGRATGIQHKLDSCLAAAMQLSGGPFSRLQAGVPNALTQLIKSGRFTGPNRQEDVQELLDVLDENAQEYDDAWADAQLQDHQSQPKVGDDDPARPGQTIGADAQGDPQVTPDYVIPLSDILAMPKFLDLNPESMWMVTMSPLNREWLSDQAAMARRSPSVAAYTRTDEKWLKDQAELADGIRSQLQQLIDQLAESQPDDQQR